MTLPHAELSVEHIIVEEGYGRLQVVEVLVYRLVLVILLAGCPRCLTLASVLVSLDPGVGECLATFPAHLEVAKPVHGLFTRLSVTAVAEHFVYPYTLTA